MLGGLEAGVGHASDAEDVGMGISEATLAVIGARAATALAHAV